ncbi:hypothetical protein Mal52_13570 [Symmachiella dynata]|uniref:Uncharacterized protein n=1 Tax=Symmachiella dynata TaxID=2527995 RepID=A0A517ZK90_9PLAN|nr:hypothetical protein [Symmachiella dynata]QDU42888.1 hypothetical protein Mal52_13570 [Symmachiella dynata]
MSVPEHLPLQHRKTLCGRVRIFEAMRPWQRGVSFSNGAHAFANLRMDLAEKVTYESPKHQDTSLDAFIHGLIPMLQPKVRAVAGDMPNGDYLDQIEAAVNGKLAEISCRDCSGSDTICTGYCPVDDEIVVHGGACLHPFKEQFDFIREAVLDKYKELCPGADVLDDVSVVLSTELLTAKAPFRFCENANAAARYRDSSEQRITEVRLLLDPGLIDAASFLAVPYLFFHELVCHAWQGADADLATSRNDIASTRADDSFAEGWMDAVAWHLFESTVQRYAASIPYLQDDHREWGFEVHRERRVPQIGQIPEQSPAAHNSQARTREMIRLGVSAAQMFFRFLRDHETGFVAEEAWLKISFALNLRGGIVQKRQEFVTAVYSALVGGHTATAKVMLTLVRKYLLTNDIGAFLDGFLG